MNFLKNKLLTIVLVLCLAFTVFIGISANKGENNGIFQEVVATVVEPIQKYVYTAGQRVSSMFDYVKSLGSMKSENERLKKQVNDLNKNMVELDKYKRENEELKSMLNFKSNSANSSLNLIGAKVIGKVGENWFNTIIIDKGSKDGIKKGQYVITGIGYVGKVDEVSHSTSKITTILDERANIPVEISSTAEKGIISGTGTISDDKATKVRFVPLDSKVKPGDKIITSNVTANDDSLVQEGIIVGTVTSIEEEQKGFINAAYVKPEVDFSTIENVMVIVK